MKPDGMKSRKFLLTLLAMALILLGYVLAGKPQSLYGDYCMSILAAAGLYKAANVVEGLTPKPPAPPVA